MLLLIDNYDSFTYNLYQYLGELGQDIGVYRNDMITIDEIRAMNPSRIVISPGPKRPDDAGISLEVISSFAGEIPILGVCLGHQSICQAFGAQIIRNSRLMHGKTSMMHHDGRGVFKNLSNPFEATRYHSLIVKSDSLPESLMLTAWTDEDEIMGVRHREYPIEGVQFHPESILTAEGKNLLKNFISPGYVRFWGEKGIKV